MKIVIVSAGRMFGPFVNLTDVDRWLESHDPQSGGEGVKIFSMWDEDVAPATPETAHECGVLLGRNRPMGNVTLGGEERTRSYRA